MSSTYPYTIDNGNGEQLTFLRRSVTGGIEILEVENCLAPGAGPPMHIHYFQDENLTVIEGRLAVQFAGEPTQYFGPGESVYFKKGMLHRFWNAGSTVLKCRGQISPPDNIEYFLSALYASAQASGKGRPSPFDTAWLLQRYRTEFGMPGIPALVRIMVFPMILTLGKFSGKHKKFKGAPEARRNKV